MAILLFIVILVLLIVVHELGHFAAAKLFGIRVDEFGIGFPPRLWGKKRGETLYSINALPFGGFVKIFGEDGQPLQEGAPDRERSFTQKNRGIQAAVLVAGVAMNVIAAWLILSAGYMTGMPADSDSNLPRPLQQIEPTIVEVSEGSPAQLSGLLPGDRLERISAGADSVETSSGSDAMRAFIAAHADQALTLTYRRGDVIKEITASPSANVAGAPEGKRVLGIAIVDVGIVKLPVHLALIEGAKLTYGLTIETARGLGSFAKSIVVGRADFSDVSGPVGIVGVVGDASRLGLSAVLSLAAVISVNLAIINLIPFPALDGGRLLIVGIEAVRRRAINPNLFLWLNAGGFAALIVLMLVVTYHDIAKLFV
jgi:regulator of sigma E protease